MEGEARHPTPRSPSVARGRRREPSRRLGGDATEGRRGTTKRGAGAPQGARAGRRAPARGRRANGRGAEREARTPARPEQTQAPEARQTKRDDDDEAPAGANNQTDDEGEAQPRKKNGPAGPTALPEALQGRGGLPREQTEPARSRGSVSGVDARRAPEPGSDRDKLWRSCDRGGGDWREPSRAREARRRDRKEPPEFKTHLEESRAKRPGQTNAEPRDGRGEGQHAAPSKRPGPSDRRERGRERLFCAQPGGRKAPDRSATEGSAEVCCVLIFCACFLRSC